jgi:hypothetical protein
VSNQSDLPRATASAVDRNEVEGVLSSNFYTNKPDSDGEQSDQRRSQKPTHYKVICISLYNDDLKRLDAMVDSLKARGMTKANRSALIRYALGEVDLETVPRGL